MKEYFDILKKSRIFRDVGDAELLEMLKCLHAETRTYSKNEFVLHRGDVTGDMGIVLTGSVLVLQEDFWGNRSIISKIPPGSIFAEAFACSGGTAMNVSVQAEKESRIMFINVSRVLTVCPSACSFHSKLISSLLSALAEKNIQAAEKMTHMSRRTTREKLLSYLSAEAERQGKSEFEIPFSRQQLADYLSVERSAMSWELCKLRDNGVLAFKKNHFKLYRTIEE